MRKNELDKLSHSYARRASTDNSTSTTDLASRAKSSLSSVNNVYQAASDATDVLRTLLASSDLSPKDLLNLTTALKNIGTTLAECRDEARRTVSDLSLPSEPVDVAPQKDNQEKDNQTLDPPVHSHSAGLGGLYAHLTKFSPGENAGRIFPDIGEVFEEDE